MAEGIDTGEWRKRYGVIESAYLQGRWDTVLERGTLFLRELLDAEGIPEAMALRHRIQLLVAHTLLHGFGDRDAAEDLYEVVRSSDAEPVLRQMATDGLDQCHQPLPSTLAREEDGEDDDWEQSQPVLFLPEADRPDLQDETPSLDAPPPGAPLAPQIPLRPLPPTNPEPVPEAATPTLGVAADPFGAKKDDPFPLQDQDAPVMPWRTEPAPSTGKGEALTVDVVEEPELIEVHQANPSLAEDVDLLIQEELTPPLLSPVELGPEEDGDLRTGLLLVVVG